MLVLVSKHFFCWITTNLLAKISSRPLGLFPVAWFQAEVVVCTVWGSMIPPGTGDNCTGHCLAWDRALPAVRIRWNSAPILRRSGNDSSCRKSCRWVFTASLKRVGSIQWSQLVLGIYILDNCLRSPRAFQNCLSPLPRFQLVQSASVCLSNTGGLFRPLISAWWATSGKNENLVIFSQIETFAEWAFQNILNTVVSLTVKMPSTCCILLAHVLLSQKLKCPWPSAGLVVPAVQCLHMKIKKWLLSFNSCFLLEGFILILERKP